jgi:hypothetical protein
MEVNMKRYINISLAVVILAGILAVSAHAQTSSAQRVIATIPFSFIVGKTTLPAGKYTIAVVNPTSDRRILQVRSMDGHTSAMVLTTSLVRSAAENSKLVFERYGDRYFFAQAQMAGDSTSLAAVRTKSERNDKAIARTGKKSVIVIVAE